MYGTVAKSLPRIGVMVPIDSYQEGVEEVRRLGLLLPFQDVQSFIVHDFLKSKGRFLMTKRI